ncbi:hypothetical protein E2562_003542 [Oryza meyeriana var. granulata]|uniref:non-specific serine/threonine protein kinase n=1 Tax=Oryza meyeriana var. granulata TaxID=110450 RepID=A0A6G1CN36_9ORYZ|nr:hypothetical protein E2562_003542 [Oryza meyeriana var. granulata]
MDSSTLVSIALDDHRQLLAKPMRGVYIFTTLIFFLLMRTIALANDKKTFLARRSSISTQDDTTTILESPNGDFSCGFYKVATNALTFSIWFSRSSEKPVAWTANRDAPVNGKGSRLTFQKDGTLALLDYNGKVVWSTNTTATRANRAELLNNGNLVVMDPDGQHLWRSFDSPTDTLLPLQPITRNFEASDLGNHVMRRLTLDYDGFEVIEPSDWSKGCERKADITAIWDKGNRHNTNNSISQDFSFRKSTGIDFWGYDIAYEKSFPDPYNDNYLKVPKGVSLTKESDSILTHSCGVTEKLAYSSSQMFEDVTSKFEFGYFLSSVLTLLLIEVILIIAGFSVVKKWETRPEITDEGYMIISNQFRRFSYKELHKATNCFQEELGSGGSGVVYKGVLDDERKVAVKKLNDVIYGEQELSQRYNICCGRFYRQNIYSSQEAQAGAHNNKWLNSHIL